MCRFASLLLMLASFAIGSESRIFIRGPCTKDSECFSFGEDCIQLRGICNQDGLCENGSERDGRLCSDGNSDTVLDECRDGFCVGQDLCEGVECNEPCMKSECISLNGLCAYTPEPDSTPCDDGDDETVSDVCTAGVCKGTNNCAGVTCSAPGACRVEGQCDKTTGQCIYPHAPDGTDCDGMTGKCSAGECKAVSPPCNDAHSTQAQVMFSGTQLSSTPVSEGMDGWKLGGMSTTLHNIPTALLRKGTQAHFADLDEPASSGEIIEVECPSNCQEAPCEVVIAVYHCPPCSVGSNGGLPSLMARNTQWEPRGCVPHFQDHNGHHTMIGFHSLIAAGTRVSLPHTKTSLANFAVFTRTGAVGCASLTDQSGCDASPECMWQQDQCVSNWCPPRSSIKFSGPTSCLPCAKIN